jgi:hypothetical protein
MAKKFKHPVVQWAHEHPILFSLFGTTIFFYFPARLIGKTIRTVKHGDPTLGGLPGLMSSSERDLFTGSGTMNIHQLGAIPSPSEGPITGGALYRAVYEEMCERARKGEIPQDQVQYYATARYNKLMNDGQYNITIKTAPGPDQGKNAGDFYRDSRHNQYISSHSYKHANPYDPSKTLPNQVPVGNAYSEHSSSPGSFAVNPSVKAILGENSVFAGLGAVQKLR